MLIYTTKTFSGDQDALNQATRKRLPDQNSIAIGIDTAQRHLSIQSGTEVPLSDSQASDAVDAFRASFSNEGYTGATIAAIDSLSNTLYFALFGQFVSRPTRRTTSRIVSMSFSFRL